LKKARVTFNHQTPTKPRQFFSHNINCLIDLLHGKPPSLQAHAQR